MWRWVFSCGRYLFATSFHYVDDTGIEPVTPTMSMWCSTAEPIVLGTSFMKSITPLTAAHICAKEVEVGTGFEPV